MRRRGKESGGCYEKAKPKAVVEKIKIRGQNFKAEEDSAERLRDTQ